MSQFLANPYIKFLRATEFVVFERAKYYFS